MAPIVDPRARGGSYGLGTYPGLRHRDGGPRAAARNEYLAAENRILKAQLKGRLKLSDAERASSARLVIDWAARPSPRSRLSPSPTPSWHGTEGSSPASSMDRRHVEARAGHGSTREVEQLIVRMAEENRYWGYDRIVGALANLGHEISDQTVGNVLRRHGLPPRRSASTRPPGRPSFGPTWRCWRGPTSSPRRS